MINVFDVSMRCQSAAGSGGASRATRGASAPGRLAATQRAAGEPGTRRGRGPRPAGNGRPAGYDTFAAVADQIVTTSTASVRVKLVRRRLRKGKRIPILGPMEANAGVPFEGYGEGQSVSDESVGCHDFTG